MRPFFHHASLTHHNDLVGLDDGREAVRDDHDGASAHGGFQRLLHGSFRFVVQGGSRFVQKQDGSVAHQRTGNGKPLPLAT